MIHVKQEDIQDESDLLQDVEIYDEFAIYYKQEHQVINTVLILSNMYIV